MSNELLTESTIERRVGLQLRAAFQRVRKVRRIGSDVELARELDWPSTYTQWLSLQRPFPPSAMWTLCAAAQCHLDEVLRISKETCRDE